MVSRKIQSLVTLIAIHFGLYGVAFAGTPRFAYVPNIDDGTISEFSVNATTGQLLPNGYVMAGDHPRSFVQVGNFAYVANMDSNNISAYSVNQSTGKLQSLTPPSYASPGNPYALIAHPNGKFLYAVSSAGNEVYIYSVKSNGSLVEITYAHTGANPRFLAISGTGAFLYAANYGSNNVTAYKVSATTGLLTTIGTYPTGGTNPSNVMVSGNFLYVTNAGSNNVSAFTINASSGVLTHVSGSPYATGTHPSSLTREYFGHFIYVGNSLSNNISVYKVNTGTGALTAVAGSPFAATMGTQALKVDPSNKFLYAADAGAEEVLVYGMNLTTGALTNTSSTRTHGIGFDMYVTNGAAISFEPAIGYVMNNDNDIPFNEFPLATYSLNPSTGGFTSKTSSVTTGDIYGLTTSATGNLLYQTGGWHEPQFSSICEVQPSGACIGGITVNSEVASGADDPQGVYHYFGETDDSFNYLGIFGYKLGYPSNGFTATLVSGSPFSASNGVPIYFDLAGKFLYTDSNAVFKVNPQNGTLAYENSTGTSVDYTPAVHPNGRFFYVETSGGVLAEEINPADGALTTLSFSATSGGLPLIEQSGKFAYLYDGQKITLYSVNATTGALNELSSPITTAASVQIDVSKNFLYLVLNGTLSSDGTSSLTPTLITVYKINHSTGALTHTASLSFPTLSSTGYTLTTTATLK